MKTRALPANVISAIGRNRAQGGSEVARAQQEVQSIGVTEPHTQPCRRLLPTKAAALYLGVSTDTLRNWRDRIVPIRLSQTKWLYDIRDLDRYVEELKREKGWPV